MKINKMNITVAELCEGYVNESDIDIERGVYAYNGKLCVRPGFQRSFVYDAKQENAVINTALMGFPLNIMYWVDNGDGTWSFKEIGTFENLIPLSSMDKIVFGDYEIKIE